MRKAAIRTFSAGWSIWCATAPTAPSRPSTTPIAGYPPPSSRNPCARPAATSSISAPPPARSARIFPPPAFPSGGLGGSCRIWSTSRNVPGFNFTTKTRRHEEKGRKAPQAIIPQTRNILGKGMTALRAFPSSCLRGEKLIRPLHLILIHTRRGCRNSRIGTVGRDAGAFQADAVAVAIGAVGIGAGHGVARRHQAEGLGAQRRLHLVGIGHALAALARRFGAAGVGIDIQALLRQAGDIDAERRRQGIRRQGGAESGDQQLAKHHHHLCTCWIERAIITRKTAHATAWAAL